jgi:phosphate transport system ATP-binding protein
VEERATEVTTNDGIQKSKDNQEAVEKKMQTQVAPSSLASVAGNRQARVPGSELLGTGLETRGVHEFIPTAAMAGQVLLDGKDIYAPGTDVTKIRLNVGMVFQKPNPFPSMTIGQNVLSGLKLAQIKRSDTDELLESCLERAGLWSEVKDRLNEHGGALSGGQQQRLCIARSLAVSPQVLLMDEPCSALDPGSTFRIEQTISELAKTMTIVIVTHNMQQAARVSDYTAFFLSDGGPGAMIEAAPTSKIFSSPVDKRTEDYVTGRFG